MMLTVILHVHTLVDLMLTVIICVLTLVDMMLIEQEDSECFHFGHNSTNRANVQSPWA